MMSPPNPGSPNTGPPNSRPENKVRRLLVAEDEWLIVDRIERALAGSRFQIAGKAASVDRALSLLDGQHFDAAILDGNLAGERTVALASRLAAAGIPFLLLTAYAPGQHLLPWGDAPVLTKPFAIKTLQAAVERLFV